MKSKFQDEIKYNGDTIRLHFSLNSTPDGNNFYKVDSECGNFKFIIEQKKSGNYFDYGITKSIKLPSTSNRFYNELVSKINLIMEKHLK